MGILTFILSPIGRLIGVGVLALSMGFYGGYRWQEGKVANLELTNANERADANQKAIDGLVGSVNAALAGNKTAADAANARLSKTASLMEKLSHVQDSKACASSPAMRTYLDSLRRQ